MERVGNCNQLDYYSKLTFDQALSMSEMDCPKVDRLKPYRKQSDPYSRKNYMRLTRRQQYVIDLWIFHEMTITQISEVTGYHYTSVSEIIKKYLEC